MSCWADLVPLGELGEVVSGSTPDTTNGEYWGGDIPWLTPADLTGHSGIYFRGKLRKITKAGYDSCSTRMLPAGSIVFSSRAPIGHCAVAGYALCTNQGFKSLIPNRRLDPVYGFFALIYYTPDLIALGRGATFLEISKEIFESFRIPLPALPEQRRIAAVLTKADRLRWLRQYALELSEGCLRAVFLEMFGDPGTNPRGWQAARLGDVCAEIYRYPTFYGFDYVESGIPVVRIGNVLPSGSLDSDLSHYVFVPRRVSDRFPRTVLEWQDILMAVRGDGSTAERIGLVDCESLVGANISPNLLRFKARPELVDPVYLFWLLACHGGQRVLKSYITRTAKKTITATSIKDMQVPLPSQSAQREFSTIAQNVGRLRGQQQEALRQAEHLFETLLHRAFRGEL